MRTLFPNSAPTAVSVARAKLTLTSSVTTSGSRLSRNEIGVTNIQSRMITYIAVTTKQVQIYPKIHIYSERDSENLL